MIRIKVKDRVNRGGTWYSDARDCRSADRLYLVTFSSGSYLGFRLVRTT